MKIKRQDRSKPDQESPDKENQKSEEAPQKVETKEEEDDPDHYFKLHTGLVKIQALVRGVLCRIRLKAKTNKMMNRLKPSVSRRASERN